MCRIYIIYFKNKQWIIFTVHDITLKIYIGRKIPYNPIIKFSSVFIFYFFFIIRERLYINFVYGSVWGEEKGMVLLLNELCFLKIMLLCAISSHLTIYIHTHTQTFICFYAFFILCLEFFFFFSIHKSYTLNNINLHFLILMFYFLFYFSFLGFSSILSFGFSFIFSALALGFFLVLFDSLFTKFFKYFLAFYLFVFQSKWKNVEMKMIFTHFLFFLLDYLRAELFTSTNFFTHKHREFSDYYYNNSQTIGGLHYKKLII